MDKKKMLIALGGNSFGNSPSQQLEIVKSTAAKIIDLVEQNYEIIITHGNGPQVGMLEKQFEFAKEHINTPEIPLAESVAMSQAYIGYHLQQSLRSELKKRKIDKECISIITQVVVDKYDPAFLKPTKPIGSFYTKEQAEKLEKDTGQPYREDAGRGYRRVVPSPEPVKIIELETIKRLSKDAIVIAAGGGGIPVVETEEGYQGVAAVIDKDKTSSMLAILLEIDILVIGTAVDYVYLNFGKDNEEPLRQACVDDLFDYIKDKQFAEGSMLPKILASISYATKTNNNAIITSLDKAKEALEGQAGTLISK